MKIALKINSCKECPYIKTDRVYTSDPWDNGYKWTCKKADKQIAGFVEWTDNPPIPKWCPIKIS